MRIDELREKWQEDCRNLIPGFELLDEDRMMDEIDRAVPARGLDLQPEDLPIPAASPALVRSGFAVHKATP